MQFGQYKKSFSSLQLENNFFRILTLGLLTLVLILVVALLNKKTIDLLHSKICSIFVIEIFEIMQRNAMCSKNFVTNVLPIIFDFSPYFLIFKKIKSIT